VLPLVHSLRCLFLAGVSYPAAAECYSPSWLGVWKLHTTCCDLVIYFCLHLDPSHLAIVISTHVYELHTLSLVHSLRCLFLAGVSYPAAAECYSPSWLGVWKLHATCCDLVIHFCLRLDPSHLAIVIALMYMNCTHCH
jgi:hypothetical protein